MELISRSRSYTSYSEENGKLIPSKEPFEKDVHFKLTDTLVLVQLDNGKLKSTSKQKEVTSFSSIQSK
jgi:hypothetical protein